MCPTTPGHFKLTESVKTLLEASVTNNLFFPDITFSLKYINGSVSFVAQGIEVSTSLWHNCLGHPSPTYLSSLISHVGASSADEMVCATCATSKPHGLPFPGSFPCPSFPLDVVHSDLSGKISPPNISGFQYYMKITDGFTSYCHILLLRTKDKAFSSFKAYAQTIETFHSWKIKKLVLDGSGKYVNKSFLTWLSKKGIQHQVTAPYTPKQNGVSERSNTITVEQAGWLLSTAGIASNLWGEAVSTAIYLENCLPSKAVEFTTP